MTQVCEPPQKTVQKEEIYGWIPLKDNLFEVNTLRGEEFTIIEEYVDDPTYNVLVFDPRDNMVTLLTMEI